MQAVLVIHGGAGALPKSEMSPERAAEFHAALREAMGCGHRILAAGGSAIDAVQATVVWLEDCPLFNAGRGSAFTRDGTVEMEASIMEGTTRRAGSASVLRQVRNPVKLAREIMTRTPHVSLAGEAAERFAVNCGLKLEPAAYFFTQFRYDAMLRLRGTELTPLSEDVVVNSPMSDSDRSSTVGAIARDAGGHLAASTSSGGTSNKYAGRVGQASQVGSGVYADDATCAVSCTGHGEAFMRAAAAFDVSALMAYRGLDVTAAANTVVRDRLGALDARGGLIALDARGHFALPFNTQGMYRGWIGEDGLPRTAIYEDWLLGSAYRPIPS
jgi:beta-aspartyl-peptidase (threonine type)